MVEPLAMTLDELKAALAPRLGAHAAFDGWNEAALAMAAAELGVPADRARLAFPGGAPEMIDAWFDWVDKAMLDVFPPDRIAAMKIRDRIRNLLLFRLQTLAPYREALRRALSILALPGNATGGARLAWRSADRIWRLAGDKAADFNHYSKRIILIGVYGSTTMIFLDDASEDLAETRAFLDRRIDDVMRFEKAKARWKGSTSPHFSMSRSPSAGCATRQSDTGWTAITLLIISRSAVSRRPGCSRGIMRPDPVSVRRLLAPILLLLAALGLPAMAHADNAAVQTAWRLLDYIAVDYRGAVADGRVTSQAEYAEMREFSASVTQRLAALPDNQARARLVAEARALEAAVGRMAPPVEVDRMARGLGQRLLAAYPVPLAPEAMPDLARGARLYADQCASCHGASGGADTEAARQLDPPPIAFNDRSRARERSLFGLYQVIEQGLEGTAMQSYASLPPADRWALAFYVGTLAWQGDLVAEGERLWNADPALRARIPDLARLVSLTSGRAGRRAW